MIEQGLQDRVRIEKDRFMFEQGLKDRFTIEQELQHKFRIEQGLQDIGLGVTKDYMTG